MSRFIIGGTSNYTNELPEDFLKTGTVIGLNKFCLTYPTDIAVCLDTQAFCKDIRRILSPCPQAIKSLAQEFLCLEDDHEPQTDYEIHFSRFARRFRGINAIPTNPYDNSAALYHTSTSATAGVDLAYKRGASEIYLWGVDLCTPVWAPHVNSVNNFLRFYEDHGVYIYKTNIDSPLDFPYKDISKLVEPFAARA